MRRLLSSAPILIGIASGLALGIIAGVLFGRTNETANWVTAAATVALTAFALVQLLRVEADAGDAQNQRRHRLEALATLARRSCQAAADSASYYGSSVAWAQAASLGFNPLQSHFLEIRSLAGGLGEGVREPAAEAFDAFIAAGDRVNLLASPTVSMNGDEATTLQHGALGLFQTAAEALGSISPRGDERLIPPRASR
jgi:hypothetical protein